MNLWKSSILTNILHLTKEHVLQVNTITFFILLNYWIERKNCYYCPASNINENEGGKL